jgi:hypothetical protein
MTAVGVEAQITEALLDRVKALGVSLSLPVAYPDVVFPKAGQTKPDSYLDVSVLRAQTQGIGISAWDEHAGILQVTVVTKQGGGAIAPSALADAVAAWFPQYAGTSGTRLVNGAVTVTVYETPSVASPIADAPYTRTPVSIRYRTFVK